MDNYLTGRERLGESPKSKTPPTGLNQPLDKLALPQSEDAEVTEACGKGGSRVSYVSENGRVTKIVVTCDCGQVTEIDCQYDE